MTWFWPAFAAALIAAGLTAMIRGREKRPKPQPKDAIAWPPLKRQYKESLLGLERSAPPAPPATMAKRAVPDETGPVTGMSNQKRDKNGRLHGADGGFLPKSNPLTKPRKRVSAKRRTSAKS